MAVNAKKNAQDDDEFEGAGGRLTLPAQGKELFDGEAKSLSVTKDVNVMQLIDEVDDRLGDPQRYQVVGQIEDETAEVSKANPLTLFVHGDADMRTVRGAVESHEKDENYGLSADDRKINELKKKLRSGKDLPAEELNILLRAMLL